MPASQITEPPMASPSTAGARPRLLDHVRGEIRARHYSRRTEEAYVHWIRRFIVFHEKQHSSELGGPHVAAFLTCLAVDQHVAASTQNQALSAVLFLYNDVLHKAIGVIERPPHAKTPVRVPVVLGVDEVRRVLEELTGVPRLVAALLYGAGLRLQECLELRVKDLAFDRGEVVVRRGKGRKDRRVVLPVAVRDAPQRHLEAVHGTHETDLAAGLGRAVLPEALDRKYPNAATSWSWQFVFPGQPHLSQSTLRSAISFPSGHPGVTRRGAGN
jgi:integron integrase